MDDSFPNGHFYSAIPSSVDVERALAWQEQRDLWAIPGVPLDLDAMWVRAEALARSLGAYRLQETPAAPRAYGYRNGLFNAADAGVLSAVLAHLRPRRVIEVGAGHSTAAMLDARDAFHVPFRLTSIEPHPDGVFDVVGTAPRDRFHLVALPVQRIGVDAFLALEPGDVLFIDSSHVAKAGSDVVYLFLEIVPRLAPGVLVHVHDVFPGFEYPAEWFAGGRYWSEAYLLRALLIGNRDLRVDFWGALLAAADPARFARLFPVAEGTVGGSVWLRTGTVPNGGRPS